MTDDRKLLEALFEAGAEAPPADLRARTLAAVEHEAELHPRAAPRAATARRRWLPRLALGGALATAATVVAVVMGGQHDAGPKDPFAGIDGDALPIQLAAVGGARPHAHADITRDAGGAKVMFHSDHLVSPGAGRHYELWLVAPDDRPGHPHRVSGGTFLPDAKGTSFTDLRAVADPDRFDVVAITVEADDGDPAPTLPDVVRSDWSTRHDMPHS